MINHFSGEAETELAVILRRVCSKPDEDGVGLAVCLRQVADLAVALVYIRLVDASTHSISVLSGPLRFCKAEWRFLVMLIPLPFSTHKVFG